MSSAHVVSIGLMRSATQDLTHVGLTVRPRRRPGLWIAASVLFLGTLGAGLGIGYALRDRPVRIVPPPPGVASEVQALGRQLEQARLGLRLSEARGHELERQIDALNQRLTETQDQLTFFRKAREGRH